MPKLLIYTFIFIAIIVSGCSKSPEWIDVGYKIAELEEKEPEKIRDIPYRLYNFKSIKKTIDIVDLKLEAQSGKAIGKEVMLSVFRCWDPDVRHGLPTVMCSSESNGDIYLSGNDKIRSQLLHLEKGQLASLVGKVISLYGSGTPIILVL